MSYVDLEQTQPDSLREIVRHLTVPAQSGVYLSLRDLEQVGQAAGLAIFAHSRRMAIEQLFRAAALDDRLEALFAALISEVEAQREAYQRTAPELLASWDARAGRTVELLQRLSRQAGE